MRYITNGHPDAPEQWALCADGQIVETCENRDTAVHALHLAESDRWDSLVAAGDLLAWESDAIAMVGVATGDKRRLEEGGGSFRSFPLPLMAQFATSYGHDGAMIVGRIDTASIAGDSVPASGVFDSSPVAQDAARLVSQQMLDRISVDLANIDVESEIIEQDEDGWPTDWLDHFTEWEVAGATLCNISAFADVRIRLVDAIDDEQESEAASAVIRPTGRHPKLRLPAVANLTAAAGDIPITPPVEWFADPEFTGPTPMDYMDDGRLLGHIAAWNSCHIGYTDRCVTPPKSKASYGYFTTGTLLCAEGCRVPVGTLSIGGGHADRHLNAADAAAHYDSTSTAAAYVAIGEDEFGIWVAGALRSTLTPEQAQELSASAPSGDWRRIDGNLELVACLGVNVPGFPMPRSLVADGQVQTLIAAVAPRRTASLPEAHRLAIVERRLARHEAMLSELGPDVLAKIRERVTPQPVA